MTRRISDECLLNLSTCTPNEVPLHIRLEGVQDLAKELIEYRAKSGSCEEDLATLRAQRFHASAYLVAIKALKAVRADLPAHREWTPTEILVDETLKSLTGQKENG
jgi:hypothetical protein